MGESISRWDLDEGEGINDMCGIVGIVAKTAANQALYDGLTVLQHRGQDAAGIATYEDGRLFLRKSAGLVGDVA